MTINGLLERHCWSIMLLVMAIVNVVPMTSHWVDGMNWWVTKSGEQSERGKVKLCRLWTRSPDSWASFLFLSCSLLHTRTYNTKLMFQRDKNSSLFLGGERTTGQDVRSSNGRWLIHFWCSLSLIRPCSTCCCIDCQHCKEFFGSCGSWQDACRRDWCK